MMSPGHMVAELGIGLCSVWLHSLGSEPLYHPAFMYPLVFQIISERTKPRMHEFQSEVFMIIGGCTKDERFVAEVTCLDPLRRSRLEVAKLPMTEHELESENKKWVEFACVTLKNEVYISGKQEPHDDKASPSGAM